MHFTIYTIVLILSLTFSVFGKPSDRIKFKAEELTPIEVDFFSKIDLGDTNIETYYDGFLIASGITNETDFLYYKEKLNIIREKARKDLFQYISDGPIVYGDKLLRWMYEPNGGGLKKYLIKSTLAEDLIDKGEYNCLSSSILYSLLYHEAGFEVKGVLTKDHAFSSVVTEDGEIDVETTLPYGFNPGKKEIEQMASYQRIIYVPKNNYRDRQYVPITTLIASLYANSISLLGRSINDAYQGLSIYKKGYYLAPEFTFFERNIIASMNNIAIESIKKGNYEEAQHFFVQVDLFAPNDSITKQNKIYYYNTIGTIYLNKKDYPSAIQVFKEGIKVMGTEAVVLRNNLKVAYYNYVVNEYNAKRYNNASFISDEALVLFPNDRDFSRLKNSIDQLK